MLFAFLNPGWKYNKLRHFEGNNVISFSLEGNRLSQSSNLCPPYELHTLKVCEARASCGLKVLAYHIVAIRSLQWWSEDFLKADAKIPDTSSNFKILQTSTSDLQV